VDDKLIWIDSPSTFRKDVDPVDILIFTHHHFLAAANLYQDYFNAELWIHEADSSNDVSKYYTFDETFTDQFNLENIKAFPIDGHTRGFTFYIFEDVLFLCDYTFLESNNKLRFNPYGPSRKTKEGARKMARIIDNYSLEYVCGYDFIIPYIEWIKEFKKLI
jgi:glyoxylase-like metal-dependent hydrolase (beta-lactamase superfamily II)